MKRRLDWPERMNEAIDAARARPFSDEWHCARFAGDVVTAMLDWTGAEVQMGVELARLPLTVAYRTMREAGFEDVGAAVAAVLGHPIPLAFARRGDVVLRETPNEGLALGICVGALSAFVDVAGLVFLPTLEQHSAYRVP